jgi:MFS family permease
MLEHLEQQKSLTANQWKIALAATIGDMLDFFDFGLIAFVLAFIVKDWHLTFGESGLILLASGITAPFGSLIWGWAADKIGRRKAMIGTVLNVSVATGAMALTPEHAWIYLVICRLFVGFGVTGMYSVDITIVQEFVPSDRRGWLTGLTTTMLPAGSLFGALLAAFATPYIGWRGLFAVGLLPALLTLYIRAWVPESPHWLVRQGRMDEARRSLAWALQVDPATIALPAVAPAVERTRWLELFKYPRSIFAGALTGLSQTGGVGLALWTVTLLVMVLKVTPAQASALGIWIAGRDRRALPLLVDLRCVGTPRRGRVQLPDRGGMHVARRLSARPVHRRRIGILCHALAAELLRQRQLFDRRPLYGRVVAGPAAWQRHGLRLRRRKSRQVHRPGRAGADRRLVQLCQAGGDAFRPRPRVQLFRFLVRAGGVRLLVHRLRDARPIDRGHRQRAVRHGGKAGIRPDPGELIGTANSIGRAMRPAFFTYAQARSAGQERAVVEACPI